MGHTLALCHLKLRAIQKVIQRRATLLLGFQTFVTRCNTGQDVLTHLSADVGQNARRLCPIGLQSQSQALIAFRKVPVIGQTQAFRRLKLRTIDQSNQHCTHSCWAGLQSLSWIATQQPWPRTKLCPCSYVKQMVSTAEAKKQGGTEGECSCRRDDATSQQTKGMPPKTDNEREETVRRLTGKLE
jgi:hypothetical protein